LSNTTKFQAQKHAKLARFYQPHSILGNDWAIFYIVCGPRMTGKSYSFDDWTINRKIKKGDNLKLYRIRISETSTKALLTNKAEKLFDPDLVRKYDLDLTTKGMNVYNKGKKFVEVIPLSMFAKLKGVGYFDKDFKGEYVIVFDEFQLESGEKRTSFSVLENFIGICENLVRTTKSKIKVIMLANNQDEASSVLKAFNFLPEKYGRFYLHNKKAVFDNLEPTEEYKADRKGSIADLLGGDGMMNYSNKVQKELKTITKDKVYKPTKLIKFSKSPNTWYVEWDGKIIKRYKNQFIARDHFIAMKPYLDCPFYVELRNNIFERYDSEDLRFDSLITKSYFEEEMKRLRLTK